jgi:hypothetical protein
MTFVSVPYGQGKHVKKVPCTFLGAAVRAKLARQLRCYAWLNIRLIRRAFCVNFYNLLYQIGHN